MNSLGCFNNYWSSITCNEEYLKVYGQHVVSGWEDIRYKDLDEAYEMVKPYLQPVNGKHFIHYSREGLFSFCAENYHEALIEFLNPPEKWFRQLSILTSEEYLTLKKLVVDEEKQVFELLSNSNKQQSDPGPSITSSKPRVKKSKDAEIHQVICPEKLYTLQEFKKRLGVSDATLRSARRAGLRVTYIHKQGFVYGRDWIDYVLKSNSHDTDGPMSES